MPAGRTHCPPSPEPSPACPQDEAPCQASVVAALTEPSASDAHGWAVRHLPHKRLGQAGAGPMSSSLAGRMAGRPGSGLAASVALSSRSAVTSTAAAGAQPHGGEHGGGAVSAAIDDAGAVVTLTPVRESGGKGDSGGEGGGIGAALAAAVGAGGLLASTAGSGPSDAAAGQEDAATGADMLRASVRLQGSARGDMLRASAKVRARTPCAGVRA
eukprot:351910-Chlamydomonas_euryale.AAC.1